MPDTFTNYFLASAGASAALIGLLFVAVSIAPERVFGREATAARRALAASSFIALVDAFFVSLVALIPGTNIGFTALLTALIGLVNTLSLGRHFLEERRKGRGLHRVTMLAGSLVVYGWEMWIAVPMLGAPANKNYVYGISYLLIGAYCIGVGRAWELLGARHEGILALLGLRRDEVGIDTPVEDDAHTGGPAAHSP